MYNYMVVKKCIVCGKEYKDRNYKRGTAKYCSHKCHSLDMIGKTGIRLGSKMSDETRKKCEVTMFKKGQQIRLGSKMSKETREKVSPTMFKKGLIPWNIGKHPSADTIKKMSISAQKPKPWLLGIKISEKHRDKLSKAKIGKCGENSNRWLKDRNKLAKRQKRNDPAYVNWRKSVLVRDGYKCKINNSDCSCEIHVHHIVPWRMDDKLRYEINNGVTLCKGHHPRKWKDEIRLIEYFKNLINS